MTYGHSEVPKTTRAAELMSPDERVLRARVAAHALHAQHDSRRLTAPAAALFWTASSARWTGSIVDPG